MAYPLPSTASSPTPESSLPARNVSSDEMRSSVAFGTGLMLGAVVGRGLTRLVVLAVGSAIIHRGVTGYCYLYDKLGVSTREELPQSSLAGSSSDFTGV